MCVDMPMCNDMYLPPVPDWRIGSSNVVYSK